MNPIDEAAAVLTLAKMAEQRATEARIEAERALIALLPVRDEGAVTVTGASYKTSVTYGFNRTVDAAAALALRSDETVGWAAQRLFPVVPKLDMKELRYLMSNEAETYALLASAITSKPAKPSVKVEALEQQREAA